MQKIKHFFIVTMLLVGIAVHGQAPQDYYAGTEGLSGQELREVLHDIISDHVIYSYSDLRDFLLSETDEDPDNPDNLILIYSGISRDKDAFGGSAGEWNREHTWAKSHGGFDNDPPEGTDAHHVRPADVQVNGIRGNLDFDNGGNPVPGCAGCYADGDSFEPRDAVKGDVARMIFYMATRYMGGGAELSLDVVDAVNTSPEPLHGRLSTLLEWHAADPPDDFEMNRNEVIYAYQENRNPFIDHPEFAAAIWGDPTGINEMNPAHFVAFPNPFSNILHIRNLEPGRARYTLYNSQGVVSKKGTITPPEVAVDLTEFAAGFYLLLIRNDAGQHHYRLIKH